MSALVFIAAGVALAAMLIWGIGGVLLRIVGILAVIDGLGGIFIRAGIVTHWNGLEVVVGLAMWMAGHWLYAAKHKTWRSTVGRAPWKLPVLSLLAPVPVR